MRFEGYAAAVRMIYEVLSGAATLWRAVLGRLRVGTLAGRSVFVSDGCVSACGVLASPTSSRRNLNLDRKSCQTTYQPEGKRTENIYLKVIIKAFLKPEVLKSPLCLSCINRPTDLLIQTKMVVRNYTSLLNLKTHFVYIDLPFSFLFIISRQNGVFIFFLLYKMCKQIY